MTDIDAIDVEAAESRLALAKDAFYENGKADEFKAEFNDAKRNVLAVRTAWRRQEEEAGRRSGFVGGDVTRET